MNNIYIVCRSYHPNTAFTNRILSFLRGFSDLGINVKVVFIIPDSMKSKLHVDLPHVSFKYMWESIPTSNHFINRLFEGYYEWQFVRMLKPGDVVFLTNFGNLLFKVLACKGVKVIHEKTEHPDIYGFYGFNKSRYKRDVHKIDGMFVISTALKEYFMSLGVPERKIKIVNMMVDNNRFVNIKKNHSERYIAYCGTASNNKDGVDELIKSFAIVHESHPDVKLYIIGQTPDKDDASGNMKLIEDLGIKDYVVFTGVVTSDAIPQILKDATVLALNRPDSLQAKCGFPTKLGEYLLSENPVVVTKVGDIPLFLNDGISALLSEERNSIEFSSKLIWALDHPKEAGIIGKNGAHVALREFNYLSETKKIVDLINELN